MNVAKGYKMTEVGVIPEDWEVKAFADVVSLRKQRIDPCRNQSENYDFCIELENIESGSGQILGYSNLRDNASLKSVFYKDDVLFGKLRAYLRKYWLADREGLCSTEIWVFVSKTEQILPSYLFQTIQSKGFIDLAITAYGTHMPRSDWNVVKNYPLLTPPLPEQQAIARVLSDTDELINALDKLIAKKRDIKKAVMQELLTGKTRLPGFSGKWEVKKLGELFDITAGKDLIRSQYSEVASDSFPFPIYANSLSNFGLYGYSSIAQNQAGCITVTARGTLGYACYRISPFVAIGRLLVLTPKVRLDGFFISELINHSIEFASESTGVPQLTSPQLSKCDLSIPSPEEQVAIAQVLSDMDKEITALEQRRDKTKALKQGMMQALLTGRIRLH
jgi:type I restriction enzyme S subunit